MAILPIAAHEKIQYSVLYLRIGPFLKHESTFADNFNIEPIVQ